MRRNIKPENKVVVIVRNGFDSKKSRSITIHDCTVDEMVEEVNKIIDANAT